MKKTASILAALLVLSTALAGCSSNVPSAATPSAPASSAAASSAASSEAAPAASSEATATGGIKTGFAVISTMGDSKSAGDEEGLAKTDSLAVAVTVDANGVITNCVIDSVQTSINFSKDGKITTDKATTPKTKNELGAEYGMAKASGIGKEWNEQADAFAKYVTGKTVDEVKGIAMTEGKPSDAELAASVTIHIGDFVSGVEKAVANAKELGAQAGDKLGLGIDTNVAKSADAGEKDGLAQAYSIYSAVTFGADGKITSCYLDGSQCSVNFDKAGQITNDIAAPLKSKNELGDAYGMRSASKIGKEWNEQAAAFAAYVTGKSVDEVKGIAVNAEGNATDAELTASVTVGIGAFNRVIEKAAANAR